MSFNGEFRSEDLGVPKLIVLYDKITEVLTDSATA